MTEEHGEKHASVRERVRFKYGATADLLRGDTAVLRGTHGAVIYGCRKILFYAPHAICFCTVTDRICVYGDALICTSFTAGSVTVEGRIVGLRYCHADCKNCQEWREEGGNGS